MQTGIAGARPDTITILQTLKSRRTTNQAHCEVQSYGGQ